jgi:hypothetical protein
LKVFSGKNFGEFWGVFLNGLMPLKIQTNFQNWFSPEFLIQNPFRFWSWTKKENCSPLSLLPPKKSSEILKALYVWFFNFWSVEFLRTFKIRWKIKIQWRLLVIAHLAFAWGVSYLLLKDLFPTGHLFLALPSVKASQGNFVLVLPPAAWVYFSLSLTLLPYSSAARQAAAGSFLLGATASATPFPSRSAAAAAAMLPPCPFFSSLLPSFMALCPPAPPPMRAPAIFSLVGVTCCYSSPSPLVPRCCRSELPHLRFDACQVLDGMPLRLCKQARDFSDRMEQKHLALAACLWVLSCAFLIHGSLMDC